MLLVQLLLEQSASIRHFESRAHRLHNSPPQSTSVSNPFKVVSLHVGTAENEINT